MTREEMEIRDNQLCYAAEKVETAMDRMRTLISMLEDGAEICEDCGTMAMELEAMQLRMRETARRMHAEASVLETELYEEGNDDECMAG